VELRHKNMRALTPAYGYRPNQSLQPTTLWRCASMSILISIFSRSDASLPERWLSSFSLARIMDSDEQTYLWQHFAFNAEQRLKAFNFFVVFSVVCQRWGLRGS
jgi:hypothetical protein